MAPQVIAGEMQEGGSSSSAAEEETLWSGLELSKGDNNSTKLLSATSTVIGEGIQQ